MSKKLLFSSAIMLLTMGMSAQSIVETTPENRNVVLEEFTGIHCTYCPDGHAIAQALKDGDPENVFLVNVHAGGYATPTAGEPDFRTPFGAAIDGQSGLAGYPAGTVNRQNFPGLEQGAAGATAMGRANWAAAAGIVTAEASYVNTAVEANIDVTTNEMTIHVETYFTGDSPVATNKLNVYILQNNTTGPQTGGGAGDNYVHQHRLIDMPTGQWGVDLTATTTGSFDDRSIVYPIPTDNNGVPVELADLEVVVSVAEGEQFIVSGNGASPSFSGITAANEVNLRTIADIAAQCNPEVGPTINVQNLGQNPITSLDITYNINGGTDATYTFTGNVTSLQSVDIELPAIPFTSQTVNTVNVSIADDENNANNTIDTTFEEASQGAGNVTLTVQTDAYSSENNWNIKNSAGTTVENGTLNGNDNTTVVYDLLLDTADCYTFTFNDTYGDGIISGGGVSLIDINGVEHVSFSGAIGSGIVIQFGADGVLGNPDTALIDISMYPNPSTQGFFNIVNAEGADVAIFDLTGRKVRNLKKISSNKKIDTNRMPTGTYFVTITKDGAEITEKLIVQ